MLRSRKELLKGLLSKETTNRSEEPLKNIKSAMGSMAHIVGNPFFKAELTLHITRTYFINGVESNPALLPVQIQTPFPVHLFGLTDYYSGYPKAHVLTVHNPQWANAIGGGNLDNARGICGFTFYPGNSLTGAVAGDYVCRYIEVIAPNTYTCETVVHCTNLAYGTFLNSFVSDLITVNQMRYFVPLANINQLDNPFIFGYQTLFGKFATDTVDPRMYSINTDPQNNIVDIPVSFPLDKNLILTFYMNFDCLTCDLVLFVNKVEPLTIRKDIKLK